MVKRLYSRQAPKCQAMPANARLYFLLARTPLHMGCGDSLGAIDKPTKRHVVTNHPLVPGSSLKGCLREPAEHAWQVDNVNVSKEQLQVLFGNDKGGTGMLSPQDGQLLLLPVACWAGGWAWVTAPAVLQRLRRCAQTCNMPKQPPLPSVPAMPKGQTQSALISSGSPLVSAYEDSNYVVLAEEALGAEESTAIGEWANWLAAYAMAGEPTDWVAEFKNRIAIVPDDVFDWLCETATDVRARNRLDEKTGQTVAHHLWREECVPEDAVFYGVLSAQPVQDNPAGFTEAQALAVPSACDLQLGGKGSVGYGWASFRPVSAAQGPVA
jgi:CRISPR-associated protein Cmr4